MSVCGELKVMRRSWDAVRREGGVSVVLLSECDGERTHAVCLTVSCGSCECEKRERILPKGLRTAAPAVKRRVCTKDKLARQLTPSEERETLKGRVERANLVCAINTSRLRTARYCYNEGIDVEREDQGSVRQ